ncbi:MAG: sulfatase-like hydrolase/transferase [Armatimonadetes bacterium]|nr:sulfatase-like hydrolase/transferase [Armatimonadota bacterium]
MAEHLSRRDFLTLTAAAGLLAARRGGCQPGTGRPNFVIIQGEGQGWSSLGLSMDPRLPNAHSTLSRTPNLAALAAAGMCFAQAYVASPRCTPSRTALVTGINPARLHMTFVNEGGEGKRRAGGDNTRLLPPSPLMELPAGTQTVAHRLHAAGYASAHFGKWHVGRSDPKLHGFDESDGANANGGPDNVANPNPGQGQLLTERGLDFMARSAAARRPFYLQLDHYGGKDPADVRPQTWADVAGRSDGRFKDKDLGNAAVMEDVDTMIGLVLAKVEALGLAGNTYVVYLADHGTPGPNQPLSGGKGTLWDGGLRVPLIVRGPGIAAGSRCAARVTNCDLMPTVLELAGVTEPLPATVDGGSLAGLLRAGGLGVVKRPREELVFHYPHYDMDANGPGSSIIVGDDKLTRYDEGPSLHLYNLAADPSEQRDLAAASPAKVTALQERLDAWLNAAGAQRVSRNPNYDPNAAPTAPAAGGGGRGGGRRGGQGGGQGGAQ